MELNYIIEEATLNANRHGWKIVWEKQTLDKKTLSVGDSIALAHSELSEALEAYRDNDKEHFAEEIADEFIRLAHMCGDLNININHAIELKMNKNKTRPKNHGRVNY